MYHLKKEAFGDYSKLTFFNENTGNGFSLIPEVGGTILELWLDHQEVMEGCASPDELENNKAYKNAFLFPFPNRLKNGAYEINGREYQFPINETETNNALHGLSQDVNMDVLFSETSASVASVTLSYFDDGTSKAYPFPFLFDVVFTISDTKGFEVKMKFTNESNDRIPAGIGWHPYFKIGNSIDTLKLKIPECNMIEIDQWMIPTGNVLVYNYFKNPKMIGRAILDNGFKLESETGRKEVLLSNSNVTLKYWQETGSRKFNFLQLYTPSSRNCIAIEPMTCNIDAFNNGDGLVMLAPEEFIEASCGVVLE